MRIFYTISNSLCHHHHVIYPIPRDFELKGGRKKLCGIAVPPMYSCLTILSRHPSWARVGLRKEVCNQGLRALAKTRIWLEFQRYKFLLATPRCFKHVQPLWGRISILSSIFKRWGRNQQVAMNLKMLHHTVDASEIRRENQLRLVVFIPSSNRVLAPSQGGDHRISSIHRMFGNSTNLKKT